MAMGRGRTSSHGRSHSGGQNRFASIPSANIQRSKFDRSCGLKTAFNAGDLIPIFVDEALPGDTFNMNANSFGRLATPIKPLMDNLYVDYFFFAVPNRLLWDNWEKFNGEQDNPGDNVTFTIPQTPTNGPFPEQSLADYFGLPVSVDGIQVSALWFRAYNLIWNEWFRDENLQDSVPILKGDGPDDLTNYNILRRGKRHDYFTSCLPWPQKGDPVTLPLTGNAPVLPSGSGIPTFDIGGTTNSTLGGTTGNPEVVWRPDDPATDSTAVWNQPNLQADLSQVTATTINDLREAFQLQRMFEKDARGGTRYTEILRSHFGVVSPDSRLQRPEFLGGGRSVVNINPVAQTSSTEVGSTTEQGNLAGFGVTQGINIRFNKSFTEHCVILGFASLRADLNYQDGIERMWSRKSRFDFFWPTLAHLGEQAVLNKEIFHQGTADDNLVFGYQERYAEYRYKPSRVTSRMRSKSVAPLDIWHLAQDFAALPVLNASFIEEDPPIDRIVAVNTEPHLLLDMYFQYTCARPMPTYSVPGLIDHF